MKLLILTASRFVLACLIAVSLAPVLSVDAAETGTAIDVFGKTMTVPAAFKEAPKQNRMIAHEFAASDGDDATARVTMMAAGGGVKANLDRWKGQFSGDAKEIGEVENFDVAGFEVHLIEVSGNYAETMGGGPFSGGKKVMRENYGMMGAIIVDPRGPSYFVKMIGPSSVIEANESEFKTMIKSLSE
ncbi:MAG: hypothetical protein AAF670_02830 [Planctomycetota bacterium]